MEPTHRDRLLTVRLNNILSLGFGLPALIYAVIAFVTEVFSERDAFAWLVLIGVVYCIVVEQHSTMRFAWLRTKESRDAPVATSTERLMLIAYNVVWWVPVVLPILGVMSYRSGSVAFLAVTMLRAVVNGYRINVMPVAAAERLPLRQP